MSRSETTMSEGDRRELQTHLSRVSNPMFSPEEQQISKDRIKELRWEGPTGQIQQELAEMRALFGENGVDIEAIRQQINVEWSEKVAQMLNSHAEHVDRKLAEMREEIESVKDTAVGVAVQEAKVAAVNALADLTEPPADVDPTPEASETPDF